MLQTYSVYYFLIKLHSNQLQPHELHLQEIIPSRSICLIYDHHRPLNTAARKFQQMLTKAEPGHPAAPKQAEGVSFISQ